MRGPGLRPRVDSGVPKKRQRYEVIDRGYTTPCWAWLLSKNNMGYGRLRIFGREVLAHRHYHEQKHGPIPAGMVLDHLCRQTDCVNPDHTEAVTQKTNVRRGLTPRFTLDVVAEMRRLAGTLSYAEIGRRFGTDRSTARKIVKGQLWA